MKFYLPISIMIYLIMGYFIFDKSINEDRLNDLASFRIALENRRDFLLCEKELKLYKEGN